MNQIRFELSLPALTRNKQLDAAAQAHAKDMAARNYFAHASPEGRTYIERIKASGFTDVDPVACGCSDVTRIATGNEQTTEETTSFVEYQSNVCLCQPEIALGENLARGQFTAQEVVGDWMASPGHRRNILEPEFTEMGIAIFNEYWVQTFGKFKL